MNSPRSLAILLTTFVAGLIVLIAGPVAAQRSDLAAANAELQRAFEAAQANARGSESLDPAYELLGIAGNAQSRDIKPLTANATNAFVELVQRATSAAQRKGGSLASDSLDQLVDLRFLARSEEVQAAMKALDTGMRTLFPEVSQALQRTIDSNQDWDERVEALNDLGSLQASAEQVLMNDVAVAIAGAFDAKVIALDKRASQEADDAERARKLGSLAEAKRSRAEQVADAKTNNVDAVAAQLKGSKGEESTRTGTSFGPDSQNVAGDTSCVETGYRSKPLADKYRPAHDRECASSGRMSAAARCPTANLSMACYARIPDGEKITYVYRNTPEEAYFRKACANEDLVPAAKVPAGGASFRAKDIALAFSCAPVNGDAAD